MTKCIKCNKEMKEYSYSICKCGESLCGEEIGLDIFKAHDKMCEMELDKKRKQVEFLKKRINEGMVKTKESACSEILKGQILYDNERILRWVDVAFPDVIKKEDVKNV